MRFFLRIFLSTWAIVAVTTLLAVAAIGWLPSSKTTFGDGHFAERVVSLVAQDLRRQLPTDPVTLADRLAREHVLDFAPVLEVYVLDPAGRDLLGRDLPDAVAQVFEQRGGLAEVAAADIPARLHLRDADLGGYRVIGYEGYFPVARELAKPGGRVVLVLLAIVVSAGISWMLARFVVLPVRRLQLAGRQVAEGDLSVRVAPTVGSRTDDIARLAHDFDVMTERVDALLQSQQRLMRDVSHELRSPLARLQALLSIARQRAGDEDAAQIDRMEIELERLDALIGDILAYSRLEMRDAVVRQPTDIVDLVQNVVDDASLEGQAADKQISLRAPSGCVMELDSGLIQSAVENVVRNALKYTAEGTMVDVEIADEANGVRIRVDDHGPGLPADALDKVFEPFYRVEDSRNTGSGGIGLAIAERSIRLHGGTVTARNREGGGLRIEIGLPRGRA